MRKVIISKFPAVSPISVLAFLLILVLAGRGRERSTSNTAGSCTVIQ
jgi:hypothetical protein